MSSETKIFSLINDDRKLVPVVKMSVTSITFNGPNGPVVTLHLDDGHAVDRVEIHDGTTPNEAAQAFWDGVKRLSKANA